MANENIDETYKTGDMYEAAALLFSDFRLLKLEDNGSRLIFYFSSEARKIGESYWDKTLNGNLKEYANSIRDIKDLIFAKKGKRRF